jgi:hypothetical protein
MRQKHLTGFVVALDTKLGSGKKVWKVRVKDPFSEDNGLKFEVTESRDEELVLAQGLNVTFLVGQFSEFGKPKRKAYDVQPVTGRKE